MKVAEAPVSHLSHFECSGCHRVFERELLPSFCEDCHAPLLARYGFLTGIEQPAFHISHESMWRYFRLLPLSAPRHIVSLGEGLTPVISLDRLGPVLGIEHLWIKDESLNPTGSFKARGLSMAVSMVRQAGKTHCVVPTAGNAGGALSAYCAKAGIKATVIMPRHTPEVFKKECEYFGAELILVDGLIDKCGWLAREMKEKHGYVDISTMKEPFRLEGKKTMGFEIAEQFAGKLPDVIVYPCGGGTGLIGIWKAFMEWRELGWLEGPLPKMIAVQAANCAPVVQSFHLGKTDQAFRPSIANGLAVPTPFAKKMILDILHESKGGALAVEDQDMIEGVKKLAKYEGLFVAPEGGALIAALPQLLDQKLIQQDDTVLLINTGSAYKYLENMP